MATLLNVTTQSIQPKSKAGYVCPSCRIVFSLPQNMGGNGATCPGCDHLLTIPSREDAVSGLDSSRSKYNKAEPVGIDRNAMKHHINLGEGEHHEWENSAQERGDKGLAVMIPIAILSLLLIGGLAFLLLGDNDEAPMDLYNNDIGDAMLVTDVDPKAKVEDKNDADGIYMYDEKNKAQVAQVEEFLTGFFQAKTVDDILPYVRPVENIKAKMIKFYNGQSISQSPFKELNFAMNTPDFPGYLSVRMQTEDYNNHDAILKYSKDEILLDWESFVGYSDMSWAELAKNKPTDAVRVRVTAKLAHYYNDEFTDEAKWQAVSLSNPNEKDAIYGYVQRGSATAQRLFNFGLSDNRSVVLDIYFPEGADKGNQVYIDRIVQQGWVVKDEK